MIKVSKETEYALICLVKFVQDNNKYSARELAEYFNIPFELLAKILQKLSQNGILRSIHGPQGGYMFEKPAHSINLGRLLQILENPVETVSCLTHRNCRQSKKCNIRQNMEHIHHVVNDYFFSLTLEDFIARKSAAIGDR
ncbi:MAG: Rrf2 family transcriptional regulator [Spirochaetales bacterium]|nr:Rrf2 family transcriptional regulator [Spirochaetales bacterium]